MKIQILGIFSKNEKIWAQRICDHTWHWQWYPRSGSPPRIGYSLHHSLPACLPHLLQEAESGIPAIPVTKRESSALRYAMWKPGSPTMPIWGRSAGSLCLSLLSCKIGIITVSISKAVGKNWWSKSMWNRWACNLYPANGARTEAAATP